MSFGLGKTLIPRVFSEVALRCKISNFKIMAERQDKSKKLYDARSNRVSEIHNNHREITDAIDRCRRMKNSLTWPLKPGT